MQNIRVLFYPGLNQVRKINQQLTKPFQELSQWHYRNKNHYD